MMVDDIDSPKQESSDSILSKDSTLLNGSILSKEAILLGDDVPSSTVPSSTVPSNTVPSSTVPSGDNNWDAMLASLPDDLKNDPTVSNFKDLQSVFKTLVHQQKQLGGRISIPKNTEEYDDLYQKLGRPDTSDGYNFTYDDEMKSYYNGTDFKALGEAAYKAGLNQKQVDYLMDYHEKEHMSMNKHAMSVYNGYVKTLKDYWKDDFDMNVKVAQSALEKYGDDDMAEMMSTPFLGSNPAMVKMLYAIGGLIREDSSHDMGGGTKEISTESSIKDVDILMKDNASPYWNEKHVDHVKDRQRVNDIYRKAFPKDDKA